MQGGRAVSKSLHSKAGRQSDPAESHCPLAEHARITHLAECPHEVGNVAALLAARISFQPDLARTARSTYNT